jgi:AGCS family alanine or glycine:cation symporter
MQSMMDFFCQFGGKLDSCTQWVNNGLGSMLEQISNLVWGPYMLVLLVGTHLFLTVRLGFIQRYTWTGIKLSLERKNEGQGDISQFGALSTALAATVGTGNIVGVATAITLGGPGAVLWMWLTGVFGIATKYTEALLSVKYRIVTPSGAMAGGPMYVLERGLRCRWLGILFAIFTAIAAFGIGNTVQAHSIADLAQDTFHINPWITGIVITAATAMVILGGIKSIAKVCEGLVPFMAIFYVGGCLIILGMHYENIPATIALICKSAFNGHAALGGFAGTTVLCGLRYGIARGLFSNESGMGSAPIVAAAAQTANPVRQALVSSTGTFWDTVVICLITGLTLVNSGKWTLGLKGAQLTNAAFESVPYIGKIVLSIGLLTFVFSTILGWSYYGEKAAEYLFGPRAVKPYRYLWVLAVMVGSVASMKNVWNFADITNALMAVPNLISLILLSGVAAMETRKYLGAEGALDLKMSAEKSELSVTA